MITKGQRINGRYEIIKSIGEGGMANVYLAEDIMLKRHVAIKVLRGDLANDEKFIRRFQREAISASLLSHPNIVEMYDVGDDNGNYYIVMEYIEGKTLKQLIKKRGNLTVSEAIDIMLQLTDGMAQAHDSYIIHRDLKPQNIMIQEDGQIKITDFGIAMALNSTQLTQTNSVMGSVHYLPPEQAAGKGSTIKSDIYSMGILFYELLTGSLPFKGENAVEIALKQMKEQIPSVRKQFPLIPQSVENIVLKATAKNPKNRYNDVREMYNDLKVCMDDDKKNVPRLMFKYPEHENDDTKKLQSVKKEEPKKEDKKEKMESTGDIVKQIPQEEGKKTKIVIGVLVGILLLIMVVGITVVLTTANDKTKNVKVPDVSGSVVSDAEQILIDKGFEINAKIVEVPSDEYEKGVVIKTEPASGRTIKEGNEITLYVSTGTSKVALEDYTGKNYIEVQTKLKEVYGLEVQIEKKTIEDEEDNTDEDEEKEIDSDKIIDQSPKKGTEVEKGDKVILYIPDVYEKYPDFVNEEWTIDEIKAFGEKYGITVTFAYEDSTTKANDTILRQNRAAGSKIVKGVTIKITLAKNVSQTEEPEVNEENNVENNEETP